VVAPSIEEFMRVFPADADARGMLHDQLTEALAASDGDLPIPAVRITTVVGIGTPAQGIAEEAARRRVDLIMMATHGYIGLQRWRLGSVADALLHTTTTPLLLVRSQAAGREIGSE
jgi:nucleotide-binding universal stress UspA family protein